MSAVIDDLRNIASAATQGEWKAQTYEDGSYDNFHTVRMVESDEGIEVITQLGCGCCDVGLIVSEADANFLETFHPQRVLALLTELEVLDRSFRIEREDRKRVERELLELRKSTDANA